MEENNTQNKIKNIQKEDNLNLKQNKQIDKRKPTTPEHYSYFKLKNEKTDNRYLITVTNFPKKKKRVRESIRFSRANIPQSPHLSSLWALCSF